MSYMKLPEWPMRSTMMEPEPLAAWRKEAEYQRARADAAMARLRVAVEALRSCSNEARAGYYDGPGLKRFIEIRGLSEDGLNAIGPLPKSEASEAERE